MAARARVGVVVLPPHRLADSSVSENSSDANSVCQLRPRLRRRHRRVLATLVRCTIAATAAAAASPAALSFGLAPSGARARGCIELDILLTSSSFVSIALIAHRRSLRPIAFTPLARLAARFRLPLLCAHWDAIELW